MAKPIYDNFIIDLMCNTEFRNNYVVQRGQEKIENKEVFFIAPKNLTPFNPEFRKSTADDLDDVAFTLHKILELAEINMTYGDNQVNAKYEDAETKFNHDYECEKYRIRTPKFIPKKGSYGTSYISPAQIINNKIQCYLLDNENVAFNLRNIHEKVIAYHDLYEYGKITLQSYAKLVNLPKIINSKNIGKQLAHQNKQLMRNEKIQKQAKEEITNKLIKNYWEANDRFNDIYIMKENIDFIDELRRKLSMN